MFRKTSIPLVGEGIASHSHKIEKVIHAKKSQGTSGYVTGLYYSNWSPYEPRLHFPHDIDLAKVSHIYYAFFVVDSNTGKIKSSDKWSDFEMAIDNPAKGPNSINGCIGELFELKLKYKFKVIMSVGGWSNRDAFPKVVKDKTKFDNLVNSCVDKMFENGFDGIDLDWEFPEDNGTEPTLYYKMVKQIRMKLNELEIKAFGKSKNRFQLSVATPAFNDKLKVLLIKKMDKYLDYWNMMTYDYYGEWSEKTGYHSNLYNGAQINAQYKHQKGITEETGLNGDFAIQLMINKYEISPSKIVLGMAAYGRGFTNVKVGSRDKSYINKPFKGVGGASEGEPGMWLYNQLPIGGTKEHYDNDYVSAYCFDPNTQTFVGYDNTDSVGAKAKYIKYQKLAGAFWWESCGDKHDNKEKSLLNAYLEKIDEKVIYSISVYEEPRLIKYYLKKFPKSKFLTPYLESKSKYKA